MYTNKSGKTTDCSSDRESSTACKTELYKRSFFLYVYKYITMSAVKSSSSSSSSFLLFFDLLPLPFFYTKKIKNREEIEQALEKSGVANYAAGVTDHEIAR